MSTLVRMYFVCEAEREDKRTLVFIAKVFYFCHSSCAGRFPIIYRVHYITLIWHRGKIQTDKLNYLTQTISLLDCLHPMKDMCGSAASTHVSV